VGRDLLGWVPSIVRSAIGTLLVGGLIGFVGSAAAGSFIQDQGWFATSGESREARAYMVALLTREADSLSQLRPQQDVVSQALAAQSAQQSQQQAKPLSLTYLGGSTAGRLSVQIYAVEVRANDGSVQLFPLALTLLGGKVIETR
jgi:hypothetical protein